MENKDKELTLEELQAKLDETRKECALYEKTVAAKKQEIEAKRRSELVGKQTERKKQIETKIQELNKLTREYVRDYGKLELSDEMLKGPNWSYFWLHDLFI